MPILTAEDLEVIVDSPYGTTYAAEGYRDLGLQLFHYRFLKDRVPTDVNKVRTASPDEEGHWPEGTGPFLISEGLLVINESELRSPSFAEGAGQLAVALGATERDAREMATSIYEAQMEKWRTDLQSAPQLDRRLRPTAPNLEAIRAPQRQLPECDLGL